MKLLLLLLLLVFGPAAAWAQAADEMGSGGPLDLRAPRRVRLEPNAKPVTIRLRAPSGAAPEIAVSAGSASAPRNVGEDVWEAEWTLPKDRHPDIAFIAAWTDEGQVVDWLRVPLVALPRITVETEPNSTVTVRVGSERFGPHRTGASGVVAVPVEAPPGVREAWSTVVDALGNSKEVRIELSPPPPRRVFTAVPKGGARLLVFAADENGRAWRSAPVAVSASAGFLAPLLELGPGLFAASYEAPDDARIGDVVELSAKAGAAGESRSRLVLEGRLPAGLNVALDPPRWAAGTTGGVLVVVEMQRAARGPLVELPVVFSTSAGTVSGASRDADGRWTARWWPPDRITDTKAEIVAAAGPLVARSRLDLEPGPAVKVELRRPEGRLRADGRSTTELRIIARDAFDNAVPVERLALEAEGTLGTLVASSDGGGFVTTYVAPRSGTLREDRVVVRADGVTAMEAIPLAPERIPYAAAVRAGYLTNFGRLATPVVTADVEGSLPWLRRDDLRARIETGWYATETSLPQGIEVGVRTVPALASVVWRKSTGPIGFFGGGGLGAFYTETRLRAPDAGTQSWSAVVPAGGAFGGGDVMIGRGRLSLELAWWEAHAPSGGVSGRIGGLKVAAGYQLGF